MNYIVLLVTAAGAVALAYWALSTEFNKKTTKTQKPVKKARGASRKPITPKTKAKIEQLAYELQKAPRKVRSDKGKKRGSYKKGKK